MNFDSNIECFSLSSSDMFEYRDYQRDCILQKKECKVFSEWYKEKYGIAIPDYLIKTLNKSFMPKKINQR